MNPMREQYKSLWHFLISNPKSLGSLALIWGMSIFGIMFSWDDLDVHYDTGYILVICFLLLVMLLGYIRVYLLYIDNKWTRK
jgi:apolipoprotein N-acyltransferase